MRGLNLKRHEHRQAAWMSVVRVAFLAASMSLSSHAGEISMRRDEAAGLTIYTLRQDNTVVRIAPEAGCNVFSIVVSGVEYLRIPDDLRRLAGVGFGVPVLYPTPNRIRGAEFVFEGERFRFPKNSRGNFIHGLVHSEPWTVLQLESGDDHVSLHAQLAFQRGTRPYDLFPREHEVHLIVRVQANKVRWTYRVDNVSGDKSVPFGFALHPYFLYQGLRSESYLQLPATHLMESEQQLPSGRLLQLDGSRFDLRQARSLADLDLDHVYYGFSPDRVTLIDFRDVHRQIRLHGSEAFAYVVVYTPDRPFFCVENQTCSTDSHNLYQAGLKQAAGLQICPPGQFLSGWVQYDFQEQR